MDPEGINSSREAKIRYLMDFCELRIGQQGNRARTCTRSLGENKTNARGQKGQLGWQIQKKAVLGWAALTCLALMGGRGSTLCVRLVAVFPHT